MRVRVDQGADAIYLTLSDTTVAESEEVSSISTLKAAWWASRSSMPPSAPATRPRSSISASSCRGWPEGSSRRVSSPAYVRLTIQPGDPCRQSSPNGSGVGRQWLIDFEHGKPSIEFGLVTRFLAEPGIKLFLKAIDLMPNWCITLKYQAETKAYLVEANRRKRRAESRLAAG